MIRFLLTSALTLALGSSAWAQTIEYGKDRTGSDIANFNLPANGSPEMCQGACVANAQCVAWTFVRTGVQGPTPRCWLKIQHRRRRTGSAASPVTSSKRSCVKGARRRARVFTKPGSPLFGGHAHPRHLLRQPDQRALHAWRGQRRVGAHEAHRAGGVEEGEILGAARVWKVFGRTATSTSAISRSTFNLQAVLDTLVESAARLCEAENAILFRRQGETYHFAANYAFSQEYAEYMQRQVVSPGRNTLIGRTALEAKTIHIPDVLEDAEYTWAESVRLGGYRTMLGVPLMREGVPVGVFSLTRQQVRLFTDKQIELVTTFADQAVIAIENVRLFDEVQARTEELSASLRQQTATAEVLKTISRTAFDLQRVFDTLVENAVRLCEAERAFLFRFDGEFLRSVASYNVSPELRDFIDRNPIAPGRHSISARAALERRTVHVSDVQADPEYAYAVRDERPIRSTLAVPMLKGDALVGTITIYRLELKPFTDKQIALVETFADQAVIAIENVRLFEEIQDKNRQLAEASEHKSQFVSSVSHELRTPLNAIIGLTEMMVTNAARFGTEKASEPLQRVNRAGTHLLGLINQVLDLSKIEAGKLELNPQTVQLAPLIDEVIGTARQLAEQNKNRLGRRSPGEPRRANRRPHAACGRSCSIY